MTTNRIPTRISRSRCMPLWESTCDFRCHWPIDKIARRTPSMRIKTCEEKKTNRAHGLLSVAAAQSVRTYKLMLYPNSIQVFCLLTNLGADEHALVSAIVCAYSENKAVCSRFVVPTTRRDIWKRDAWFRLIKYICFQFQFKQVAESRCMNDSGMLIFRHSVSLINLSLSEPLSFIVKLVESHGELHARRLHCALAECFDS